MSNNLLAPEKMLRDAQWNIDWRKAEIVKAKIRADFTKADGDYSELNRNLRELEIEQNYLDVLAEKFSQMADTPTKKEVLAGLLGE